MMFWVRKEEEEEEENGGRSFTGSVCAYMRATRSIERCHRKGPGGASVAQLPLSALSSLLSAAYSIPRHPNSINSRLIKDHLVPTSSSAIRI
eukprot:2906825-Rhodomonas_salina.5